MNGRIFVAILAASAGPVHDDALAVQQGQVGSSSQASISIKVSVAPRIQLSRPAGRESDRPVILCLVSNMSPSGLTMIAVPSRGDRGQAMVSRSSAECAAGQGSKASLPMPVRPEAGSEGMAQLDQGAVILLVHPE